MPEKFSCGYGDAQRSTDFGGTVWFRGKTSALELLAKTLKTFTVFITRTHFHMIHFCISRPFIFGIISRRNMIIVIIEDLLVCPPEKMHTNFKLHRYGNGIIKDLQLQQLSNFYMTWSASSMVYVYKVSKSCVCNTSSNQNYFCQHSPLLLCAKFDEDQMNSLRAVRINSFFCLFF